MSANFGKAPKCPQLPSRPLLVPFITFFSLLVCYSCMNQISLDKETLRSNVIRVGAKHAKENVCTTNTVPFKEMDYIHFPQPKTYSRKLCIYKSSMRKYYQKGFTELVTIPYYQGECACTPVRYFVIVSMQRSGSGWFETLLNSHPNISSNGEIFSVSNRRANLSIILNTLDTVYNLDWFSSAAKNECTAAYGLKWMLNQGVTEYHREIISYFKTNSVSVIFLFRRNLLRRLISVLANDYDRQAKQLNGTHKAHVHSKEEAEILAKFKPKLEPSSIIPNLQSAERTIAESLHNFSSIRHMVLYYEDIINNRKALNKVQEFLKVPVRKLVSQHVKIHTRPLHQQVDNWSEVLKAVNGTEYAHFLNHADYGS